MSVYLNKSKLMQLAYGYIGRTFNTSSELGPIGSWASELYDLKVPALLASDYWSFSNTYRELAQLSETPLAEWQYAYQLPSDYLTANYVTQTLDYYIFEDKLYSNLNEITLNYRFMPENPKFRADFMMYLVYELAADYSLASEAKDSYQKTLRELAETWRIKATASSAKATPNRSFRSQPLTSVRGTGSGTTKLIAT